jgi:hypothetical protein
MVGERDPVDFIKERMRFYLTDVISADTRASFFDQERFD